MGLLKKIFRSKRLKKPATLRVVTFNVHFAPRPLEIVKAIRGSKILRQADIFMFQEIESHESEVLPRTEVIATTLGFNYFYAPSRTIKNVGSHGIAIVSKLPLENPQIVKLPFYNLMFNSRTRIALTGSVKIGKIEIHLCNVHLDTTLSIQNRIRQIGAIVDKMDSLKDAKIILGGDFNTLPLLAVGKRSIPVFFSNQRKKFNRYMAGQGYAFTENTGYTITRGVAGFKLDGVFVKNLEIVKYGVERSIKVSDHKPVWADIKII